MCSGEGGGRGRGRDDRGRGNGWGEEREDGREGMRDSQSDKLEIRGSQAAQLFSLENG